MQRVTSIKHFSCIKAQIGFIWHIPPNADWPYVNFDFINQLVILTTNSSDQSS